MREPALPATGPEPAGYPPHPRYLLYLVVALGACIYLGWLFLRAPEWTYLFFIALCVASAAWAAWNLGTAVATDASSIVVRTPLGRARRVDYRQFAEVAPGGRFLPTLVVLYYPLRADGLLDLDELRSLHLPATEARDELLADLQKRTP